MPSLFQLFFVISKSHILVIFRHCIQVEYIVRINDHFLWLHSAINFLVYYQVSILLSWFSFWTLLPSLGWYFPWWFWPWEYCCCSWWSNSCHCSIACTTWFWQQIEQWWQRSTTKYMALWLQHPKKQYQQKTWSIGSER